MDRDEVLAACAAMPGASEEYPFGESTAVFKVEGKIFALVALHEKTGSVSVKCDPDLALVLRDRHVAVRPGYHLNKQHWNTVDLDGSVPHDEIAEMLEHSYDRVVRGLPRAARQRLTPDMDR
jgi:predicted DNA-binding protein (MmcQ/YjbR family)